MTAVAEDRALAAAARLRATPAQRARLAELVAACDPQRLAARAAEHRVSPLLDLHLGRDSAPHRHRALAQAARLVAALQALAGAGLDATALKGPALAAQAHGEPGLRESADLDLLVARADLEPARAALAGLGYRPLARLSRARLAACHELALEGPDGLLLELHWATGPRPFGLEPAPGTLARRTRVNLLGRPVPVLAPADALLHLAAHGARHCWSRLGWLVDVDALVTRHPAAVAEARALATGPAARALEQALDLAARLAGPDPGAWEALVRGEPTPLAALRAHLDLRPGLRARLGYLAALALTPSSADLDTMPVLAAVPAATPILRPLRLARRQLRG